MEHKYTEAEKRERIESVRGRECTLNGVRAIIGVDEDGYASIGQLDAPMLSCQFSWTAVWNILDNRAGCFYS